MYIIRRPTDPRCKPVKHYEGHLLTFLIENQCPTNVGENIAHDKIKVNGDLKVMNYHILLSVPPILFPIFTNFPRNGVFTSI